MREFVFKLHDASRLSRYALHQKVWEIVRGVLGDGVSFLFREEGDLVKVRHQESNVGRPLILPGRGDVITFDVLVYPTKTDPALGKKVHVYDREEAVMRMRRKIEDRGIAVEWISGEYRPGRLFGKPQHKNVVMPELVLWGKGQVTDEKKVERLLACGVGKGKRFGFGMVDFAKG